MVTGSASHQGLCELEEAWVVRSLVRICKLRQLEVADLLGRHKSWVCRRLQIAEQLDGAVQDDMRLGLLSASVAREVVRLPRGNQAAAAEAVRTHGLTSRQSGELVDRLLAAEEPAAAAALLDDPHRYLSPPPDEAPARTADPRLTAHGEQVRQWLLRLEGAASGMCHALRKHLPQRFTPAELDVLAELAAPAEAGAREAAALIERLREAAGGPPHHA
jgi:hypothetical protein